MGARRPERFRRSVRVVKPRSNGSAAEAPRCEVVLELARLEQRPRSKPAHVAIGDVRVALT